MNVQTGEVEMKYDARSDVIICLNIYMLFAARYLIKWEGYASTANTWQWKQDVGALTLKRRIPAPLPCKVKGHSKGRRLPARRAKGGASWLIGAICARRKTTEDACST